MRNAKQVQLLAIGMLLGTAVAGCGAENSAPGRRSDAGAAIKGQDVLASGGYEEIRCRTEQPRPVLFIARPGQAVKKGDLLVELDAFALAEKRQEQETRVMRAEAELANIEASAPGAKVVAEEMVAVAERALHFVERQLADYRAGEYPAQQVAARNEAMIAEERATMLKQRTEEMEALYKEQQSQSLERELLEVRLALTQARAEATAAQDKLKLLKDMIYPRKTEELKLAIAQRNIDLVRARNDLARITLESRTSLLLAQHVHRMEEARSQRLSKEIEACKLYAPRDGTVISPNDAALQAPCEPEVRPGDTARPGQLLLRLADLPKAQRSEGQTP